LNHRIFLNPLNDISQSHIAAQDILQFPNRKVKQGEGPYFPAAFSTIKRDFCFARFLAYEGFSEIHPKFEAERLFLTDTLDYVRYEGYIEKLKTAFRICFSTFDSIALLMHEYFGSGHKKAGFTPRDIRKISSNPDNPFLSALYWLSCDLYDIDLTKKGHQWDAPNPSAAIYRKMRNACEHGWLRIADGDCEVWDRTNDYAYTVTSELLELHTMSILKLARSAISYFFYAISFEENRKKSDSEPELLLQDTVPIIGSL